jgi:hypothetical protein
MFNVKNLTYLFSFTVRKLHEVADREEASAQARQDLIDKHSFQKGLHLQEAKLARGIANKIGDLLA